MSKFKLICISIIGLILMLILIVFFMFFNQTKVDKVDKVDNVNRVEEGFNKDFDIAVIESTEQDNISNLTFYNKELKKTGTQEIKLGSMGSPMDLPRIYDKYMYVVPQGIGNQKELTVILEYNMETGKYKTYDMKQHAINSFAVNDKSIYSVNDVNDESIISWFDKSSGNVKTISKKAIYISNLNLYDDTLYAFAMEKVQNGTKSYLYLIDTKSFMITDTIDISAGGQNYSTKIGDDFYFTNQLDKHDQASNILTKFNIKDKTILDIKLKDKFPLQILNYKDKLIISHFDRMQRKGNTITIYDPKTNEQQNVTLESNLEQIFIKDDKLYSMGEDYVYIYSINNSTFKLLNKADVRTKRGDKYYYYLSGLFAK
jgi:hypothetical protein